MKIASVLEKISEKPAIAQSRYESLSIEYKAKTAIDGISDDRKMFKILLSPFR